MRSGFRGILVSLLFLYMIISLSVFLFFQLLKALRRLGEVPMTVDILVETGVGKTVNSFRKHEVAGEMAKSLVAKWKKLVPQSADRYVSSRSQTHARGPEARGGVGHRHAREPSPEEEPSYVEEEDEEEDEEERGYHTNYSPSPPQHKQYNPPQRGYQSDEYESPEPEPEPEPDPPPPPPRKEVRHTKPSKEPSRNHHHHHGDRHRDEERQQRHTQTSSDRGGGREGSEGKKHSADRDRQQSPVEKPVKHSKKSSTHQSKREEKKKGGDDGEYVCRNSLSMCLCCVQVVEAVPILPDIPLPAIQPNYRPLPSIDVTPLSPQRRKVPAYNDEEDAGFTGKRFNSKMVVYSGSKTAYLPKMMTLYEQCIRVLQNNIDSIAEVGGVPFDILEPVLERCTPEQLYRIEQSNQCFTEDSDDLWMRHCHRDFKRESPQEYESWREMYLRLHDEREERLRLLTQNITSAHANKPKGRQVKMAYVNSVAKPPRDVRRRQEKFGTTSGSSPAASTSAATPIKPTTPDYSGESSRSSSSQHNPPSTSSRSSAPSGGAAAAAAAAAAGHVARDKPQVKKIAPMMAKTIKAFKNRFSRR
uniref:Elongin A n=1 Tax=Mastacembelus armatus TaxID=205130 RepID=A0A3Q3LNI2_9TELE